MWEPPIRTVKKRIRQTLTWEGLCTHSLRSSKLSGVCRKPTNLEIKGGSSTATYKHNHVTVTTLPHEGALLSADGER